MEIRLAQNGRAVPLLVESAGWEGVRRIAAAVAEDICLVTDVKPEVLDEGALEKASGGTVILCATAGRSPLLEELERRGKFSAEEIRGKREVFKIALAEEPFPGAERALVICGSDKRGTIYGMFTLSEYIGVTPLVWFGDAAPAKHREQLIREDIETVSGEPSVRYRGFFINDEWPCFGTWAHRHFGGVNAEMYRLVFEFLLRMKGNYLWPAMWSSSFPLDGPGSANEELADLYGVVMGYSHHEPCLRASEEWDKVRGKDSRYGDEWNFYTNEQGLLNYWEDALKRSGKYENIITIGMRGERDTSMLGENATVEENVNLLKNIIRKQRQLIKKHVNEDLSQVPQMLALYKEVEAYFYGDGKTPGLKDWEELDGVICMLCEDNFGHMRTLPTEEMRGRRGGFGMYYHFDYHGGPISYEWVDSTPLSKTWEQMCTAYEYGIRDLWIVNVGDLKFHEVPLTFFLAMAYDYDRWGASNPESPREFTARWAQRSFPRASEELQKKAAELFTAYIDMNHLRRPESLNETVYHPCHELEADRMLALAERIEELDKELTEGLCPEERDAYYSMAGFAAAASANLLKMHLTAGKSRHYASQGRHAANRFAALAGQCIEKDRRLAAEFALWKGGKWSGMELAAHIGFRKWNEDGSRYPVLCTVEPMGRPALSVSRKDEARAVVKNYGRPEVIRVPDFLDEGCEQVILEIANEGKTPMHYEIVPPGAPEGEMPEWLRVTPASGEVDELQEVRLICDRSRLPKEPEQVMLLVRGDSVVAGVKVTAARTDCEGMPPMTFLPRRGVITVNADHFARKKDVPGAGFERLAGYGRYGVGMKVAPCTVSFEEKQEKPELTYRFLIRESGRYRVELLTAPVNPAVRGQEIRLLLKGGGEERAVVLISSDYRAGESGDPVWSRGVLDQIHKAETVFTFEAGVQELTVGALEAGTVLERIRIYREDGVLPESYLGPVESWHRPE
ncbi:MAG: glycosyl hydrolase 115 family protein [bacterium]|nr:glycosyl hydrolase 115 family protein [bacterium]